MSSAVRIRKESFINDSNKSDSCKNKFVATVFFIGLIAILAWIGYGIYLFTKRFKFIPKSPDGSKEIA